MNKNKKVIIYILVLVALIAIGLYFKYRGSPEAVTPETPLTETPNTERQISISKEIIKEKNFTGSKPIISGEGELVIAARAHVGERMSEFKTAADTEVPAMREQFGAGSPPASYTIDIEASEVTSEKTQSLVLSESTYTGGASTNSSYKVLTASKENGDILSLSDIVPEGKRAGFTDFVKQTLINWRVEGAEGSVVFTDVVNGLTFNSLENWSLDDKNLNLYFSKYEVGPGALGAVVIPLPLTRVQSFLNLEF